MAARRRVVEQHEDWLNLTDAEAPWFSLPALKRALPNGLDPTPPEVRAEHRARWYGEADVSSARLADDRTDYLDWLLRDVLGWRAEYMAGDELPPTLAEGVTRHDVTIAPTGVYRPAVAAPVGLFEEPPPADMTGDPPTAGARVLVFSIPVGTDPRARPAGDTWPATWVQRSALSCQHQGVPLALVTDGDHLTLVHAPRDGATGWGTWRASEFATEPVLLDSFRSMLHARRFLGASVRDTPEALLIESAGSEAEVTDQLGTQVRRATELLTNAISRANRDRGGTLLAGVEPHEVYEAAVTVMMRIVFLLVAEEKEGLLPVDNRHYQDLYAVRTLRESLQQERDANREILETRTAAWHRLLSTSRAVHSGVHHDELWVPAYGGDLFDPDRFPFLEGRPANTTWRTTTSTPIAVTDLDVLAILNALLVLRFRSSGVTDTRRLSYRHVHVEQIGHIYERLLDHDVVIAQHVVLGLRGKPGEEPEIGLPDLEAKTIDGDDALVAWLSDTDARKAGRRVDTKKQVAKLLAEPIGPHLRAGLVQACHGDQALAARIEPFANLLRLDLRGRPLVFLEGAVYVTETGSRRDSGTAYTTKELADEVVEHALAPLCYSPGPQDTPDTNQWRIRPSDDIAKLKVCDPAVGSGAILVAACRYLADRLIEAWRAEGDPRAAETATEADDPTRLDVVIEARRMVAEHCCYGVDRNPMAVEMAKLSMWLTTVAKNRPFTFLDHALKAGDSLLGIWDLDQLRHLHYDVAAGRARETPIPGFSAGGDAVRAAERLIDEALGMRREMHSIETIRPADIEQKQKLLAESEKRLAILATIADVLAGAALSTADERDPSTALTARMEVDAEVIVQLVDALETTDESPALADANDRARLRLDAGRPDGAPSRRPLHWPIAFPEVWDAGSRRRGFDALVGNPPYLGGTRISGPMGSDFRSFLATVLAQQKTDRADLVTFFLVLAGNIVATWGALGFITTQAVSQGQSRSVGLQGLLGNRWFIFRADPRRRWPNTESVYVALLWMTRANWEPNPILGQVAVPHISSRLQTFDPNDTWEPRQLAERSGQALQGAKPSSNGFILSMDEAAAFLRDYPDEAEIIRPYMSGSDFNSTSDQTARRSAIYFGSCSEAQARSFPGAFEIVRERVPETRRKSKPVMRERFWQFEHPAVELMTRLDAIPRWIAFAETSRTLVPSFVERGILPANGVVGIPSDDWMTLGILSSEIHYLWVLKYTTYLKTDPRYVPSRVYETFPFPAERCPSIESAIQAIVECRNTIMTSRCIGLTSLYSQYHDPTMSSAEMNQLRQLHSQLDRATVLSYGWDDLIIEHRWRPVNEQGLRFTIAADDANLLLQRLLRLNKMRYEAEVAAGLHRRSRKVKKGSKAGTTCQGSLLGDDS